MLKEYPLAKIISYRNLVENYNIPDTHTSYNFIISYQNLVEPPFAESSGKLYLKVY